MSEQTDATDAALKVVAEERQRQFEKWGDQRHDIFRWLAILGEEVGEANTAALHAEFGGPEAENLRKEFVQVAAVAVQVIEHIDRGVIMR